MASLVQLPYELLLQILTRCSTIQDAVRLASTSYQFRNIWLENTRNISASILGRTLPCYGENLALVTLETAYNPSSVGRNSLDSLIPSLLRNARSAEVVILRWMCFLDRFPGAGYTYASPFQAYYMIRLLLLSYHHEELRPSINERLMVASIEVLATTSELCCFICSFTDIKNQVLQKVQISKGSGSLDDSHESKVGREACEFVKTTLDQALEDRREGDQ